VQAVLANTALSVVEFVVTSGYRLKSAQVFSEYFTNVLLVEGNAKIDSPDQIAVILRGSFVGVFAATLGTYGLALFALTRPSSRAYLAPGPDDSSTDTDEI
jgi:hypothetical protein